ncbi:MAG TPA: diacylglycerol kinase family protein [Acidimicrobiia bacterium]
MQRLLLIANPASSQFTGGVHRKVSRILSRRFAVESAWPQSADHARQLTEQAVADSFDVIAAMGGDGVVHHIGQAVAGTESTLAVIPTGTTNVYSRLYGIPRKPVAAAKLIVGAHDRRREPLLEIEGVNEAGPVHQFALFAAGFGFDADVVKAAESEPYRKYWFGGLHYGRKAVATVLSKYRTRKPNLLVSAGDRRAEAVAVLVQFHPIYTYFGRLALTLSKAPPEPLTLLVVEAIPARRLLRIASKVLLGGDLARIPGLRVWEGVESFTVTADPPTEGQADGELSGAWKEVGATSRSGALRVIVPVSPPSATGEAGMDVVEG